MAQPALQLGKDLFEKQADIVPTFATFESCYMGMIKGYDFSITDKISVEGRRSAAGAFDKITEIISCPPT